MKKETYEEHRRRKQRANESQDLSRKEKTLEKHPFEKKKYQYKVDK